MNCNVELAKVALDGTGTSRNGTAVISIKQFAQIFGPAHETFGADTYTDILDPSYQVCHTPKVTVCWYFKTPRGVVTVRDYWWNSLNELSIGAQSYKAALWVARHLRQHGIVASARKDYKELTA
jgi:hypothetical protein